MVTSLLRVDHASRRFGGQTALDDVSFQVRPGEILGIIGRSGAGKTTLLRCLNGLERPDSGRILIEDRDITTLPERELVQVRRRIGLVFQHFNLLNSRTVAGNIELPLQIAGVPRDRRRARAGELLDLVGLAGHADKRPSQLSGGQKQRVGIARALAAHPALLLCDEATSALDPETTLSILDLLRDINRRLGLTIILITHEMDVIRRIAQRILVMDRGRVVEDAETAQVLRGGARHDVTRAFLHGESARLPDTIAALMRPAPFAGGAPLVRLTLDAGAAGVPVLSVLGRQYGIDAAIVQAGMADGGAQAECVVRLSGHDDGAMDFLRQASPSMEVLGYVPADS
ncbi:methionine ABC transporter ATP-binding protein [Gluconacetobacter takamatsuzukensis]|uniref:Cell division ATP-binding protein FtsE n=1 Tax=Gluconacetobacter takamatsuzukensis TaxID=1286190 RepID=A0A7W4KBK2_9PROT|nr:ATP-binding cassette domain-containing protein [Gluconacetobacter takamatsuzukensis]MBB2203927.1 ATP-binding cassette domain-containing protein [Gluconacetobacter takamatsuzukensis]